MLQNETKIRVRYGETDQMGYAYYGVYAQYYEVGRVEAMRLLGFSYKEVEERGIMLPVVEYSIKYKKPAYYDEELRLVTVIPKFPDGFRIAFEYTCYNEKNEVINTGQVTLVCVDRQTAKPTALPDWFRDALRPFFPENG